MCPEGLDVRVVPIGVAEVQHRGDREEDVCEVRVSLEGRGEKNGRRTEGKLEELESGRTGADHDRWRTRGQGSGGRASEGVDGRG